MLNRDRHVGCLIPCCISRHEAFIMTDTFTASGHATSQSTAFTPIMLDPVEHRAAIDAALDFAERAGLLGRQGPVSLLSAGGRPRSWSLAADQTPFKNQSDRGACW